MDVELLGGFFSWQVDGDSNIWELPFDDGDNWLLEISCNAHFIILYFRTRIIISLLSPINTDR